MTNLWFNPYVFPPPVSVQYPPAGLTGFSTTLANGTYVVTRSTPEYNNLGDAWRVFNRAAGSNDLWNGALNLYNITTGAWVGGTSSPYNAFFSSTSAYGEWVKLQLPVGVALTVTSYSITSREFSGTPGSGNYTDMTPRTFYLLGSNDDTTYSIIDYQANVTWAESSLQTKSFVCSASPPYRYLALLVTAVGANNEFGCVAFTELSFYGY